MLNRYPMWKYLMLIMVILVGLIYALPNFYGEKPALQITGTRDFLVRENTLKQIINILEKKNINTKSIILENGVVLASFGDTNAQLEAREALMTALNNKFIITLKLTPATPKWLEMLGAEPMKLGLDLRGGVHFLMDIDASTTFSKLQEQAIDTLCNELHTHEITYASVRKFSSNGIEIYFHNSSARDKAMSTLHPQQYGLRLYSSGNKLLKAQLSDKLLDDTREYAIQQNITILRNRINQLGVTEPIIQRQGDRIVVELPGIQDTALAKEILGATATLEFRLVNTATDANTVLSEHKYNDSEVKYTRDGVPIVLYKRVMLTGDHITYASSSMDEYHQPQVNILLDSFGGNLMSEFTKDHIGQPIATLFVEYKDIGKKNKNGNTVLMKQEEVINIATINSRLGKSFRITGIGNHKQAHQLTLLLRAGTLIAPVQIIEEKTIGPTLGKQNIHQGMMACLCGLVTTIIFMLAWYHNFGIIATSALITNLILIVGVMSMLPGVTLTMPGIAGLVLTLAVAVDANVLINERIKEELNHGRSVQQSIHSGYKGALSSIIDANMTALITAAILYVMGSGPIKGFAITTIIGVITSMFTSIIGTRAMVNLIYGGKQINKLSI